MTLSTICFLPFSVFRLCWTLAKLSDINNCVPPPKSERVGRTWIPIGQEAATNWALQFTDRDRFVEALVTNLPDRPPYFDRSVAINLRGAPFLSDRSALPRLGPAQFNVSKQQGATILDVRPAPLFGEAHAAESVNIGVAGPSFSVWCGSFVNPDLPIALVVEYEKEAQQAQLGAGR